MSTAPEQEDRRSRRRFVLLWFVSVVAVAALLTTGALALFVDDGGERRVDAGGSGTAPVYDSPPVDVDPVPEQGTAPTTTTSPDPATSREVLTRTSVGGGAVAPEPGASGAAVLGPPRTHGVNLLLTSKLNQPLRPGVQRALYVTVRNPNAFPVDLYRVDVRVDAPPVAGCLKSWVRVGHYRFTGGTPQRVTGNSSVVVNLPIEMVNLVDVDQNACQNTYFPLRLSGVAVDPS